MSNSQEAARRQFHIRPVARDDVAALKDVIDHSGMFPSAMLDGMLAGYLSGEALDDAWLTVDDGTPGAVAYYVPERMTQGTWNLLLIAVHPNRQGQGYGAALMRHVEQALRIKGQRMLLVETSSLPEFERARSFYARLGYEREARIRDFYEQGNDKIIFRRDVGSALVPRVASRLG